MNSTATNLMDAIREAISEQHARMETLPFAAALTNGELPLLCYVGELRALAVIYGTLEHELRRSHLVEMSAFYLDRPSHLTHLRSDLRAFDQRFIPDCLDALDYARSIAELIRVYRVEQPTGLLGVLSVLEETSIAASVRLPDVIKTFGDQVSGATRYYYGYGARTDDYRREFRHAMNAVPLDQAGYDSLLTAVHRLFDQLQALYRALYPVQETGWGFTADMLNPEAGRHAVPDNASELQAATSAARRCLDEFPYFELRYEERGRGFAKSDAAWLVTLIALPQAHCLNQVAWLGRVLANRGMPRITLERQLELLYDELQNAVPSKREQYVGLLEAAEYLKVERQRLIPEETCTRLARRFHGATDGELQGRFKNTGMLLVAAVCDEAAGIPDAVTSLVSWLTDADRFSGRWIAAVTQTVELARGEMVIR